MRAALARRGGALLLAAALALPVAAPAAVEAATAADLIERSNRIVGQLTQLKQKEALTGWAALEVIQREMSPLLSYEKLTRRAMGKHWRRTDEQVRAEIVLAFRTLLENTYAKVLAQYSGQQVELVSSEPDGEDAISVVLKIQDEAKSVDINYLFEKVEGDYRVVDIKVEGISLVANYRRQFSSVIAKDGAAVLAEKLRRLAAVKMK